MGRLLPAAGPIGSRSAGNMLAAVRLWLSATLVAERVRWPLWMPALFGVGIAVYFALPVEPPLWPALAAIATVIAFAVSSRPGQPLHIVVTVALLLVGGFGAAQLRTLIVAAPVLARHGGAVLVEGRVHEAESRPGGQRLTLDRLRIARLAPERTPQTVRISVRQTTPVFRPGDVVRMRAVLQPPAGPVAPGAFDYARMAWFDGLGGLGYATGHVERVSAAGEDGFAIALERLRQRITERIQAVIPGATGGLAAALVTGDRGAITEDVNVAMRNSGLAHLISISGLHMGIVAGVLFFVIRFGMALLERPALRWPVKKWAAAATLVGSFGYLLISGNTPPPQRSFLMLALMMIAVMVDRQPISMNLVAWAAAAILLLTPESLLNVSFQMSFAAVIALIAVYEVGAARLAGRGRDRRLPRPLVYLGTIAISSVVATLATLPFAAYHFNRIALYGVLSNLIAVPLSGFWVMPAAVAAVLLMPLGLERLPLVVMGWGVDVIIAVARWIAALPGAVMLVPAMPAVGFALTVVGGLWLCLWRRRWRFFGLVPIAAGFATLLFVRPPDILVDNAGKLFAVRAPDGRLALSSRRTGFSADTWLRRSAQAEPERLPGRKDPIADWLRCDSLGCVYRAGGHVVALVHDRAALDDDCTEATVVISAVPIRRGACRGPPLVVDRYRLWRDGPHAFWLGPDGVEVESVGESRGERPWTDPAGRYRRHRR
jgi:competence protein ComEC